MTLQFLFAAAWQGAAILAALWAISALLRNRSAAARHLVWTVGMFAILLMPAIAWLWPEDRVIVLASPASLPLVTAASAVPARTDWNYWLIVIWASGASLLAARLAASWFHIWRITARARRVAARVRETHEVSVPMTWGLWRYDVLIPATSADWSDERRTAVLLHETAHADRKDGLTQLAAQLTCCLHWFNPLAWLAERQMATERERACDDVVVARGLKASDYAGHLVSVARALHGPLHLPAAVAMGGRSQLEQRVRAILDMHLHRGAPSRRQIGVLAMIALGATLPLAALRAQATGTILGVLYDPSGAVVPGASLVLMAGSHRFPGVTEADGGFRIDNVVPGNHRLQIQAPGFVESAVPVDVQGGRVCRLYPMLQVGEFRETLEIIAQRTPNAAGAQHAPLGVPVGGSVQPARLIQKVAPAYPRSLEEAGINGTVQLAAIIQTDGRVGSIRPIHSPHPDLTFAAKLAVENWRYLPAQLNGKPVSTGTTISVHFELGQ